MGRRGVWDDVRRNRRRQGTRPELKRFLIVTEGATEAGYFCHYKMRPLPEVKVSAAVQIENPTTSTHLELVKEAVQLRNDRVLEGKFVKGLDEAWVVMDRDINGSERDADYFNQALALAEKEGIHVAVSCDSFELWYLLHFQEVSSSMHRKELDSKLSKHLGRSYKSRRNRTTVEDLYSEIRHLRSIAIERAKKLHDQFISAGELLEGTNPYTSVFVLVERLMSSENFRE